jgi:hypothetical protein
MTEWLEQRYCIKFCRKLSKSQVETIRKTQTAFGDDLWASQWSKEWYNQFKYGRTSVDSEPRNGRLSSRWNDQVIAKVNAEVMRDRRVTIRQIAEEVDISTFSAHSFWQKIWPWREWRRNSCRSCWQRSKSNFILKSQRTFWTQQTVTPTS